MVSAEDFYAEQAAREAMYINMHAAYLEACKLAADAGDDELSLQYLAAAKACRRELQRMFSGRLNQLRSQ